MTWPTHLSLVARRAWDGGALVFFNRRYPLCSHRSKSPAQPFPSFPLLRLFCTQVARITLTLNASLDSSGSSDDVVVVDQLRLHAACSSSCFYQFNSNLTH